MKTGHTHGMAMSLYSQAASTAGQIPEKQMRPFSRVSITVPALHGKEVCLTIVFLIFLYCPEYLWRHCASDICLTCLALGQSCDLLMLHMTAGGGDMCHAIGLPGGCAVRGRCEAPD